MHRFKALCLVLHHLSWPQRFSDTQAVFGGSKGHLSTIFNLTLLTIYRAWKHLLLFDHGRLTPDHLQRCADHVTALGALFEHGRVFAFIDGTHERICRPGIDQEEFYSGQKKYHAIKCQAITTPDGIVIHFGGPFAGRRHDGGMATDSRIRSYLCSPCPQPCWAADDCLW
jgi:hypothetical protein